MIALMLAVLLGLGFTYFATQNIAPVTIQLGTYVWTLPLYFISVGSLLMGLFIATLFSLISEASAALTIHNKESEIAKLGSMIEDLKRRINHLEMENANLRTNTQRAQTIRENIDRQKERVRNFFDRLRYRLSY